MTVGAGMQDCIDGALETSSRGEAATSELDSIGTLGLLIAALEMQRRTSLALYRLLRGLSKTTGPSARRQNRARPRGMRHITSVPPRRRVLCDSMSLPSPSNDDSRPRPDGAPMLQVRCFGRFEVHRDGVPIAQWRRGKAKLLLKFLLVRRQPVPRDVLIDLLWPEADPRTAVNGLRVALHALRQALGPCGREGQRARDYVIFEGGNYGVNPAADLWVDADEFSSHFVAGMRLERQGQIAAAIDHFEKAENLYRDDYLLEDLYEDWTLVRREELKDQYLMVLTKLADACLNQGDAEGCIVRCHRILQKDACREDAYRRLMRCYVELGQRSQALHWFDLCVQTLRRELDVAPSEPTTELYGQICLGKGADASRCLPTRQRFGRRSGAGLGITELRP